MKIECASAEVEIKDASGRVVLTLPCLPEDLPRNEPTKVIVHRADGRNIEMILILGYDPRERGFDAAKVCAGVEAIVTNDYEQLRGLRFEIGEMESRMVIDPPKMESFGVALNVAWYELPSSRGPDRQRGSKRGQRKAKPWNRCQLWNSRGR